MAPIHACSDDESEAFQKSNLVNWKAKGFQSQLIHNWKYNRLELQAGNSLYHHQPQDDDAGGC